MATSKVLFCICWTVFAYVSVVFGDLHSSNVKVARCRAQCLDKFTWAGWTPSDTLCQEEADCFMCWESCDLLNQNFVVWGSMCSHNDICFPGCQQSCGFYLQDTTTEIASSSLTLKFSKPISFVFRESAHTLLVSWLKPEAVGTAVSRGELNIVYVVLRRSRLSNESMKWLQVTQTSELSVSVDMNTLPPSATVDFKVIAVTGAGMAGQLVTSYHVSSRATMPQDGKKSPPVISINSNSGGGLPYEEGQVLPRWKLHLVALRHNAKLGSIDAVVTWASPGLTGNFLVTWEVKEGTFAITGHLYTDSTTVSLTLWPETVYSVQVELVSSTLGKALRSEPLTIDTRVISGSGYAAIGDESMAVIEAPTKECTDTLVIASISVGVSALLILVGAVIFIRRRWRLKSDLSPPQAMHSGLKRVGALRRKAPLPALSLDVEGGYAANTFDTHPPSSSLDDKMSAFRAFFDHVEKIDSSLSPKAANLTVRSTTAPQMAPLSDVHGPPLQLSSTFRNLPTPGDIFFTGMEDDGAFELTLPTQKLLGKANAKRSLSTAI